MFRLRICIVIFGYLALGKQRSPMIALPDDWKELRRAGLRKQDLIDSPESPSTDSILPPDFHEDFDVVADKGVILEGSEAQYFDQQFDLHLYPTVGSYRKDFINEFTSFQISWPKGATTPPDPSTPGGMIKGAVNPQKGILVLDYVNILNDWKPSTGGDESDEGKHGQEGEGGKAENGGKEGEDGKDGKESKDGDSKQQEEEEDEDSAPLPESWSAPSVAWWMWLAALEAEYPEEEWEDHVHELAYICVVNIKDHSTEEALQYAMQHVTEPRTWTEENAGDRYKYYAMLGTKVGAFGFHMLGEHRLALGDPVILSLSGLCNNEDDVMSGRVRNLQGFIYGMVFKIAPRDESLEEEEEDDDDDGGEEEEDDDDDDGGEEEEDDDDDGGYGGEAGGYSSGYEGSDEGGDGDGGCEDDDGGNGAGGVPDRRKGGGKGRHYLPNGRGTTRPRPDSDGDDGDDGGAKRPRLGGGGAIEL